MDPADRAHAMMVKLLASVGLEASGVDTEDVLYGSTPYVFDADGSRGVVVNAEGAHR